MQRYFDAFVYVANWYSCHLSLRVPKATFSPAELAQSAATARRLREAQAREKRETERLQQRETALRQMMRTPEAHWKAADEQAARGIASGYDQATQTLKMLAEGYALVASPEPFEQQLRRFLLPHAKRAALLRRLAAAGLWQG